MSVTQTPGTGLALVNARILDPLTRKDSYGSVIIRDGLVSEIVDQRHLDQGSPDLKVIDCQGAALIPGLIDIRVKTGEPGDEPKETLKSAAMAAAKGGVTTIVVQPDTHPVIDEPAMLAYVLNRGRENDLVKVHVAGAATRGLDGKQMAEIGLMAEQGALYFTDSDRLIQNSKVLSRVMSYAGHFGAIIAHRPKEPWLSDGSVANGGDMAARMGLSGTPAIAERIALERDLALVEMTGARFLVDQVSTAEGLSSIHRAKEKGLEVFASVSINHLSFNELDIGDYRTFYRLDPPLRSEKDRLALIEAVSSGLIDVVTSAHTPLPAEDKRLPFSESTPGAVGLETLLSALLSLHHEDGLDLLDLLATVTLNPARMLGLDEGRIEVGAPADLCLVDLEAPRHVNADLLASKSKNSPFDGRRLQGQVLMTTVSGKIVYRSEQRL